MLSIDNGSHVYNYVITKVNYILLDELTLTVVQLTGEITNINFENTDTLDNALQNIKNKLWRQLATIPSIVAGIGYLYFINVCNVYSHSVNSENITINFNDGNPVVIQSASSYEADNHNEYLSNIFHSTHLNEYIENKTKHYVDDGMSRAEIQTVINNAGSGDVVIFENGTYNEMYFDFKDGVDLIMGDVEFVSNTNLNNRGIFKDLSAVTCKVFGRASYTFGPDNEGWLLYDQFEDSDVYVEFYKIISQRPGHDTADTCAAFHQRNGKLRYKGYHISGNRMRTYDSDTECKLIDIDVLYNIINNGDTHFFPSQGQYQEYLDIYIRNGYYEANGTDVPAVSFLISAEGSNINIISLRCVNNNPSESGVIISGDTPVEHTRIWYSDFYVSPGNQEPITLTSYPDEIEFYGICNSNNELVTNEYTGDFSVDPDFGIERFEEYDEDADIMGTPSNISITDGESGRIINLASVDNIDRYELFRDETPISKSNSGEVTDNILFDVSYRYRTISETGLKTIFTKNFNATIMPLTDMPIKSKYTVEDTVYYNNAGAITELTINAVYVYVDNPNNDSEGRQVNNYGFEEINQILEESRLFASKNSLLKNMKSEYLNVQGNDVQHRIVFNSIDSNISGTTIKDLTGLYLYGFDFTHMDEIASPDTTFVFDGETMCDDSNFEACTLPANVDTKAEFKALVKSYDKDTTIWTDGNPIGI